MSLKPTSQPFQPKAEQKPVQKPVQPTEPHYDADFPEVRPLPDFQVTLVARDGVRFRVSANVLRTASSVFDGMLAMPQPNENSGKEILIDTLDEDGANIKIILQIISGKEYPDIHMNFDAIRSVALAAEKWDMPGPPSMCKMLLLNPELVRAHAVGAYWAGCHFQWKEVVEMASGYTYHRELFNTKLHPLLNSMSAVDLLRLIAFHRKRHETMLTWFEAKGKTSSIVSSEILWDYFPAYNNFKYKVLDYMETLPPFADVDYVSVHELALLSQLTHARTSEVRSRSPDVPVLVREVLLQYCNLPRTVSL
ncbi:hypothetical protein M422DRAFT_65665 [Sphaerobolus stellatus SS14]|nr:hypothetical protein M422DRAFT_65665 [Sphaerobolus stellatus SS14]